MAIVASGVISLADLQTEFGTSSPVSLSQFYLDGSLVTPNNTGVPNSGNPISLDDFYGVTNATNVIYEIIGGGGGGGYGVENGTGSGSAGTGGNSTLAASAFTTITSTGAIGGLNAPTSAHTGLAGAASYYGPGGSSVGQQGQSQPAPAGSYGAGAGGAGGDNGGVFGTDGGGGRGGSASVRVAGTLTDVPVGTVITVTIGSGGAGGQGGNRSGVAGAGGYARLQVGNTVQEFTSSGTFTVPS
jgi:hypothetical protein